MIKRKRKDHSNKIRDSILENPKRFWSFIKSSTNLKQNPYFLRDGVSFVTSSIDKANLLNRCFHSVFSAPDLHPLGLTTGTTVLAIDNVSVFPPLQTLVLPCPATFHGQGILKTLLQGLTKPSALSKEYARTCLSPLSENFSTVHS